MNIIVLKEYADGENRVAATPETVSKLISKGFTVNVESGAGQLAGWSDEEFIKSGGIVLEFEKLFQKAGIYLAVQVPNRETIRRFPESSILVSLFKPVENKSLAADLNARKISAFSLELVPRITRAQSMDVLSSQANLAGYKAVLLAAHHYGRLFPTLMTAAGTVKAARLLVIGAGVAGLQAIATAKRLGAVVSAFDIRSASKEQVQSLGASFVEIDLGLSDGEGKGGYARELTANERTRQVELLGKVIEKQDIVITTAAVPGRPAPKLIAASTVNAMRHGSVIVDLAAESGGNCELTHPGDVIVHKGVTLIGTTNIPSLLAPEASALFARNVMNFVLNLKNKEGQFYIDRNDEIVAGTLLTYGGEVVHSLFK